MSLRSLYFLSLSHLLNQLSFPFLPTFYFRLLFLPLSLTFLLLSFPPSSYDNMFIQRGSEFQTLLFSSCVLNIIDSKEPIDSHTFLPLTHFPTHSLSPSLQPFLDSFTHWYNPDSVISDTHTNRATFNEVIVQNSKRTVLCVLFFPIFFPLFQYLHNWKRLSLSPSLSLSLSWYWKDS